MGFEIVRVTCRGWYGSSQPWFRIVREMLAANRPLRRRRWQASARHHLRTTGGSLWQHSSSSQLENLFLIRVLLSFFPTPDCSPTSSCCKAALLVSDDTKHLQRDVHMPLALHDDDARVYIYQVDGAQEISRNATLCSNSSSVKQQELPLDHCCLCVVQNCCAIQRGGKQGPAIAKSGNAMAAISSLLIQIPSAAYQQ